MNNKTIIEFGFLIIWRILDISEGVIRLGLRPRRITPTSISIILHKIRTQPRSLIVNYYLFKIFPHFWLVKSTRIIYHNQLLMINFGQIWSLTRKWRQKCSPLQVKTPLPRSPGDDVELFWLWKKKADISFVSKVRTTAGTRRNNS